MELLFRSFRVYGGKVTTTYRESQMSAPKTYSKTQIALHWGIALLILYQLIRGEDMKTAWEAVETGGIPVLNGWIWAHIIVGIAVLALVIWRLALRLGRGVPAAPEGLSKPMVLAGEAGHWALYALMFAAPISGLMAWYGGVLPAAEVHELFKPLIIILVVVHVAAALWHHFIRKDGLLNRMRKS